MCNYAVHFFQIFKQIQYVVDSWIEYIIRIKAVLTHESKESGHYICYKYIDGTLLRFDDTLVNLVDILPQYKINLIVYRRYDIDPYEWNIDLGFLTHLNQLGYSLRRPRKGAGYSVRHQIKPYTIQQDKAQQIEQSDNQISSSVDIGNASDLPLDMSVTKQGPVEESEVACDENQGISMAQESEELIDDSSVNNATTNQSRTVEDIVVDQGNVIEKVTIDNEGTNVEMVTENSNVQFQGHDQNSNETCSDMGTSLPLNTDTPLDNGTAIPLNVVEEGTNGDGDVNEADMQTDDPQKTDEVHETEEHISNSSLDKERSVSSNIVEECSMEQGEANPVNMDTEDGQLLPTKDIQNNLPEIEKKDLPNINLMYSEESKSSNETSGNVEVSEFDETVNYGEDSTNNDSSSGSSPHEATDDTNSSPPKVKPDWSLRPPLITPNKNSDSHNRANLRHSQRTIPAPRIKPKRVQPKRAKKNSVSYLPYSSDSECEVSSHSDTKDKDFVPEGIKGTYISYI